MPLVRGAGLALLLALALPVGASAAPTFAPPSVAGTTGNQPQSVAIGDLDGDGRNDLATADTGAVANRVTVITRNAANTGWNSPVRTGGTGMNSGGVAIGDLDGDRRNDLATADDSGVSGEVTVITRNAANTGWNDPVKAGDTGQTPAEVAIGDLDGDGRNDLATANINTNSVTVITRNAANTGWNAPQPVSPTTNAPYDVAIGDLDGDGRNDLATADQNAGRITVFTRNATNTGWNAPDSSLRTGFAPQSVTIADLDGDGRNDLATADAGANQVSVFTRNATNSGWNPRVTAGATGSSPSAIEAGDLDGDRRNDLVTADAGAGGVTVIARDAANAGWSSPVSARTGSRPFSVALGDLDSDGRPDLATADEGDDRVSVLANTTTLPAPATTITSAPTGSTLERRPTFTFTSPSFGARFACAFDDAPFTACASPLRPAADLPFGARTFRVQATTAFGGTGPAATAAFTVAAPPSPPPAARPAPTRPTSRPTRPRSTRQPITLRGTASPNTRRVRVSVARRIRGLCRFLRRDRTFARARACSKTSYLDARGTTRWTLRLPRLPRGSYQIWSRAIATDGTLERKNRTGNLLRIRIR